MRFIYSRAKNFNELKAKLIADIDYKSISNNIPLTDNAINQWKLNKNVLGYSRFIAISEIDCISIISATKRQQAEIIGSRYYSTDHNVILYRLIKEVKS